MKSVGTGFTFHAWIYLAPPLSLETPGALRKRMLYYFGAHNGAGFQAFFRNSGTLVIATVTKKREFINLCLLDCPLTHSAWVSLYYNYTLFVTLNFYDNLRNSVVGSGHKIHNNLYFTKETFQQKYCPINFFNFFLKDSLDLEKDTQLMHV